MKDNNKLKKKYSYKLYNKFSYLKEDYYIKR